MKERWDQDVAPQGSPMSPLRCEAYFYPLSGEGEKGGENHSCLTVQKSQHYESKERQGKEKTNPPRFVDSGVKSRSL